MIAGLVTENTRDTCFFAIKNAKLAGNTNTFRTMLLVNKSQSCNTILILTFKMRVNEPKLIKLGTLQRQQCQCGTPAECGGYIIASNVPIRLPVAIKLEHSLMRLRQHSKLPGMRIRLGRILMPGTERAA